LSLGYRQIKLSPKDNLDGVSTRGVSLEYTVIPFDLTNTLALFVQYESIILEHLNKLVVEPIDNILIFSMFEDIHIGNLALLLENS
jgi:hypothetical protein